MTLARATLILGTALSLANIALAYFVPILAEACFVFAIPCGVCLGLGTAFVLIEES